MSVANIYTFVSGEFTQASILQAPAGSEIVPMTDQNKVQLAGYDVQLWDDAVQLILDTDYTLQYNDTEKSSLEGQDIWAGFQIVNPAYEATELTLIAKIIGGYTLRTYRPSYVNISADSIYDDFQYDDITVYVDVTTAPVVLTLADGERKNQTVSIIADGVYNCTIQRGLLDDIQIANQGTQVVWSGVNWVQLGGTGSGTGGDTVIHGNLQVGQTVWSATPGPVPYDKLYCDGSLYNIADYPRLFSEIGSVWGGDGVLTFAVPNLLGIFPGAIGVQGTHGDAGNVVGQIVEDSFESHTHTQDAHNHTQSSHNHTQNPHKHTESVGANAANANSSNPSTGYRPGRDGDGAHCNYTVNSMNNTVSIENTTATNIANTAVNIATTATNQETGGTETRPASAMGRWFIQAYDTVQEVPGDPSLIKDYVQKFGPDFGDTPAISVVNAWGNGLFYLGVAYTYEGQTVLSNGLMGLTIDGDDREILIDADDTGSDSLLKVRYVAATNTFTMITTGSDFTNILIRNIYLFEDVANGELNPPVDGWEVVYTNPDNIGGVSNQWGSGAYELTFSDVVAGAHLTVDITIAAEDVASNDTVDGASVNSATNGLVPTYTGGTTNEFGAYAYGVYVGNITKIRKFNSLVNVVHTWNSPEAVDTDDIADGAITTPKLADDAVTLVKLAQEVLDFIHPVGMTFMQLAGTPSPVDMGWTGTWEDDSATYAGEFFRVEGGNASGFESGTQAEEFKEHTHIQNSHTHTLTGTSSAGGSSDSIMMNGDNLGNKTRTSNSRTATNQDSGGVETRPVNSTIRIWKRTA